jgi:cytochrome P450
MTTALLPQRRRPPSTRGLLGDRDRLPDRFTEIVTATDGVARVRAGPLRLAVIADPGLARTLLTLPNGVRKGRGVAVLRFLLGDGLLTSEGEVHRQQRRLMNPVFHPRRLAGYGHQAVQAGLERAESWSDGMRVDLAREMNTLTLDVVGRTLFGIDLSREATEIRTALDQLLPAFPRLMRPYGFMLMRIPSRTQWRLRSAGARLDGVVERLIAARRDTLEESDGGGGDAGDDVLSLLLAARDEDTGEPMPPRLVRDEVLTLMLAGHETTAVALAWTWFELCRHPEEREALVAEIASPSAWEAVAAADWERLHRTRAVIAESIRLHPPAHMVGRRVVEPIDLGGHRLEPGTLCVVAPYALQRDPRSWSEPLRWRPDRWLNRGGRYDESAPGQPRGAYLPFGAGTRICIGATFATMEATLLLAVLASRFRADLAPGFDPGYQAAVTLRLKNGLPATLRSL